MPISSGKQFACNKAAGKAVEDLESHDDYQEWIGEIHVRGRILAELDTLEHVVYEHS